MYSKELYKFEIKKIISDKGYHPDFVAKKTYEIYTDHAQEIDQELRDKLFYIINMEMGPEFEFTEDEFIDFLNKW